ncbi:GuaB3 family IMP dehydrogenase-related protein [Chloroflexota bacterium]
MSSNYFKDMRVAYGFDEVALVPGEVTINPEQTEIHFNVDRLTFELPVLAAAMDAVVDLSFAVRYSKLGGLAVLNLEGVQTRYDNPEEVLIEISRARGTEVTVLLQKIYSQPVDTRLIGERIKAIKEAGARCAVSVTPASAKLFGPFIAEAGADVFIVQATVTTARHSSKSYRGLIFSELCKDVSMPVIVGNCVSYEAALEIMRDGVAGILVGVGPGAACTTREVLGVGVPQVTATMDCAAARQAYFKESGRYVGIITDGGIRNSGDMCKAFAAGADAVMLGSVFAQTEGAPGGGFNWGMANPHPALPRGTRIRVGTRGTLEQLLLGPSSVTDGSQNLIGALRTCMGMCGAVSIKDMHGVEMVIAPSVKTEGKLFQMTPQGSGPSS